jgi:glycine cleavage system H protein
LILPSKKNSIPKNLHYAPNHTWIKILDTRILLIGITYYAQDCMRGILSIELPKVGKYIKLNETIATIETVKATIDIFSPLTGKVLEVNQKMKDEPILLGIDPYNSGWIAKMKIDDMNDTKYLMDSKKYKEYIDKLPPSAYTQHVRSKIYDSPSQVPN